MRNRLALWLGTAAPERIELLTSQNRATAVAAPVATAAGRQALVVNEEAWIRALVRLPLGLAGFDVTELADGARAVAIGRTARFDVIVLDGTLPSVDGITVCQALRAEGPNVDTPILMISAWDRELDNVEDFETGADDCIAKPFAIGKLTARINALLGRLHRTPRISPNEPDVIARRGVVVNVAKRTAIAHGRVVNLTKLEFELLRVLMSRPGIVFSREALLSKVWGGDRYVTGRTVDAVISRLRKQLEAQPHEPELILTVWGVGYKCADIE